MYMKYDTPSGSVLFESLWRTRYENEVPVTEMDDEHILNTIDYLGTLVDPRRDEFILPFNTLNRTEHNIEVLKRELIRRTT